MSDSQPNSRSHGKAVTFRGGGFAPQSNRWIGLVVFVVLVIALEIGTRTGFITNLTLPRPSDVLATFVDLWKSGLLWNSMTTFLMSAWLRSKPSDLRRSS